jgi:hypothetical protein
LLILGAALLSAPSLLCHSSWGRGLLSRTAQDYGWEARVEEIRFGWITPLRLDRLELRGLAAKTEVSVEQVQTELTLIRLLRVGASQLGRISARGVVMALTVDDGTSSLEQDLAPILTGPSSSDSMYDAQIDLQDVGLIATDVRSGDAWKLSQAKVEVDMQGSDLTGQFVGVLTEPSGNGGGLQGSAAYQPAAQNEAPVTQLRLQFESFPLSVVTVAKRRLGETAASIPAQVLGDTTGRLSLDTFADGRMIVTPERIEVRNFAAADPSMGTQQWTNRMAGIDGALVVESQRVVGRKFQLFTDFATASIDGAVSTEFSLSGANDNPVQWLDALQGTAGVEIDLAAFHSALPGVMPLRGGTEIVSGKIIAQVETIPGESSIRRSRLSLASQPIRARVGNQNVAIEPIECSATVVNNQGELAAEAFAVKSTFATASGQGSLRSGSSDIEVDFGRLASSLRPIFEIPENSLAGNAKGNIGWNAANNQVWKLNGSVVANDVRVAIPGGQYFAYQNLRSEIAAVGVWDGSQLAELTKANFVVNSTGVNLSAELLQPVRKPTSETLMPIQVQGDGRIEALVHVLAPWIPADIRDCEGGYSLTARGDVSADAGRITVAEVKLTDPRIAYQNRYFAQPHLNFAFRGEYAWPSGNFIARDCTLEAQALTARMRGEMTDKSVDLEIACNTQLERIQSSVRTPLAKTPSDRTARSVGFRNDMNSASEAWMVKGDVQCNLMFVTRDDEVLIECQGKGTNLAMIQPSGSIAGSQVTGPQPPNAIAASGSDAPRTVWSEPNVQLDCEVHYQPKEEQLVAKGLQISGDWFAAELTGQAKLGKDVTDVVLNGPCKFKMEEVGRLLTSLAGTPIDVTGIHETPLEIKLQQPVSGDTTFDIVGSLGWESVNVAGVMIGPSKVPVRMTESKIVVSPAIVPLAEGRVHLAGEAYYRPGPVWISVPAGRFAEGIRLTPEMNNRWLKYLAPIAADAARIDGTMGVTFDEAIVVIDEPERSRVVGRLDIQGIQMTAGPLTNQLIGGVEQLKSLAKGQLPQQPASAVAENVTLVTMPAQTVDFNVVNGVVSHERMFFQIDRAQVITSGQVGLDSRLSIVAQVPLDARWLGSDLQGLAGQSVSLPIAGTLSRPTLDSSGMRQVVKQLGGQAIQSAAENLLQQQLGRGLDKLFGK